MKRKPRARKREIIDAARAILDCYQSEPSPGDNEFSTVPGFFTRSGEKLSDAQIVERWKALAEVLKRCQ